MNHRRASRLLPALLDGGLDPARRRAVQAHARECPACRRRLREHEAVESLLRLLPAGLLPLEPTRQAQRRLWQLGSWFADPLAAWRERWRMGAFGFGATLVTASLMVSLGAWAPLGDQMLGQLPSGFPDVAFMLPLGWR